MNKQDYWLRISKALEKSGDTEGARKAKEKAFERVDKIYSSQIEEFGDSK